MIDDPTTTKLSTSVKWKWKYSRWNWKRAFFFSFSSFEFFSSLSFFTLSLRDRTGWLRRTLRTKDVPRVGVRYTIGGSKRWRSKERIQELVVAKKASWSSSSAGLLFWILPPVVCLLLLLLLSTFSPLPFLIVSLLFLSLCKSSFIWFHLIFFIFYLFLSPSFFLLASSFYPSSFQMSCSQISSLRKLELPTLKYHYSLFPSTKRVLDTHARIRHLYSRKM